MSFEERAIQTLALRQPMASDLRQVVAAIKIASTLERIGDLGKNIAKRTLYLNQHPPVKVSTSIVRMGRQVQGLVSEVLDAYTAQDTISPSRSGTATSRSTTSTTRSSAS